MINRGVFCSYPFCEDVNDGLSYMKTRCPSWCDRILMSQSAKNIIVIVSQYGVFFNAQKRNVCIYGIENIVILCQNINQR